MTNSKLFFIVTMIPRNINDFQFQNNDFHIWHISYLTSSACKRNTQSICHKTFIVKLFVLQSFQIKFGIILLTKLRFSNSFKLSSLIKPFPPKNSDYTSLFQLNLVFQLNFLTNEIASIFSTSCIICISLTID